MFFFHEKAHDDDSGRVVNAVKVLDYSGSCERPFELPLRQSLLWKSARYADLHGEFPDGEARFGERRGHFGPLAFVSDDRSRDEAVPPLAPSTIVRNGAPSGEAAIAQASLERVRLACGKCHWCANRRKRRWERAATGWVENSPLTLFGTLTFSDEYFSSHFNAWIDGQLAKGVENEHAFTEFDAEAWRSAYSSMRVDRFDPKDAEHDAFMRQQLCDERQKLIKRLRHALGHDVRFEGVNLKAHLAVYEYGDLRGRLHMHFLMHFDIGETPVGSAYSRLRQFLKQHWDDHGVGFVDVQHATPEEGVESAKYLCQYLLAYEEEHNRKRVTKSRSRLAVSQGYRVKGTEFYFAARPSLIPGGSLRPVDPVPPEERNGFRTFGVDADAEDLHLSEASKRLTLAEMPNDFRVAAEQIAKARLAFNTGELWPGWSDGLERPEDDWAEVPDGEFNFAAWLLSRYWKKNDLFRADIQPEDAEAVQGDSPRPAEAPESAGLPVPAVLEGEVLGLPTSERAMLARGLGPDTVIRRDGTYRRRPSPPVSSVRRAKNFADGTWYDPLTGEIFESE